MTSHEILWFVDCHGVNCYIIGLMLALCRTLPFIRQRRMQELNQRIRKHPTRSGYCDRSRISVEGHCDLIAMGPAGVALGKVVGPRAH